MTDRKILVTTGYETDQNNALTEMVIPSTVETLNAPTKITFLGDTLNYIPSPAAALQEFSAPNMTAVTLTNDCSFYNYTALTSVSFPALVSLSDQHSSPTYYGSFSNAKIVDLNFPLLKDITIGGNAQVLRGCNNLVSFTAPNLETVSGTGSAALFNNNNGIASLNLPKFVSNSSSCIFCYQCTGLSSVTLGSDGHPVTSLGNTTFNGCTQSSLTITIYTTGGAALSGSPWGATNATIVWEEA